jgi:hypothetical protein
VVIQGSLTAQQFNTEFVSASIIYESGSTKFGDTQDDTHQFTGSLQVSGSSELIGNQTITGSILITGSISYPEYIDLDTTPAQSISSTVEGRLVWDNGSRTFTIGTGNNVDILAGQSEWAYVYNAEATALSKGEVVYVSGSQGNTLSVKRAANTGDDLSAGTLGVVGETINSGAEGLIIVNGLLRKLDTTGFTAGALLYLSSTPGVYTETIPTSPSHSVRVGYVVKVDALQGEIYVKVDNGYEIGELHDIIDTTTTSTYGDLLVKSGSVWKNQKQLTGSYGLTGSLQATSFTGSLFGTASYSTTASYALTSSYLTPFKSGEVVPAGFNLLGGVYVANVSFATAYSNTDYSISVIGGDARTFTVDNKLVGGFRINTNSGVALGANVYWMAIPYNNP